MRVLMVDQVFIMTQGYVLLQLVYLIHVSLGLEQVLRSDSFNSPLLICEVLIDDEEDQGDLDDVVGIIRSSLHCHQRFAYDLMGYNFLST